MAMRAGRAICAEENVRWKLAALYSMLGLGYVTKLLSTGDKLWKVFIYNLNFFILYQNLLLKLLDEDGHHISMSDAITAKAS
jgi:hypothetical protein